MDREGTGRDNHKRAETDTDVEQPTREPTAEVASEGGSFGDVEIADDEGVGTGSEAGETWRPSTKG